MKYVLRWLIVVTVAGGDGSKENCNDTHYWRKDQHFSVKSEIQEVETCKISEVTILIKKEKT